MKSQWTKVPKLAEGNYVRRSETLRFLVKQYGFYSIFDAVYNLDVIMDDETGLAYFKASDVKNILTDNTYQQLEIEVTTHMVINEWVHQDKRRINGFTFDMYKSSISDSWKIAYVQYEEVEGKTIKEELFDNKEAMLDRIFSIII